MAGIKIGSLCTGYGGLDMAVEAYYDAQTIWASDTDKSASVVIDKRWNIPNLGDLKQLNGSNLDYVDIITAGYPCQPFSVAGKRKGVDDERHLWPYIKKIISDIRPKLAILENVRGHLTLGFKEVLKDLAEIGFNAKWATIRASDVGAPHQRARLFIITYPNDAPQFKSQRTDRTIPRKTKKIEYWTNRYEYRSSNTIISNTHAKQLQTDWQAPKLGRRFATRFEMPMFTAPNALVNDKLNPQFVEYIMGLPIGYITDLELSNAQMFKLLGNGVVPQQAYKALEVLNDL